MSKLTLVFPLAAIAFILMVFAEYIPLMRQPLKIRETERRMTGKDRALCLMITLLYAISAFLGLGDMTGIERFCKFEERGEYALIEFTEPVDISAVRCYHGLFMGRYNLEFSPDGETYQIAALIEQGHADIFKWKSAELTENSRKSVRSLRLTAGSRLWMGEMAVYDENGLLIGRDRMIIPHGCDALFDEQEKIPAEDSFMNSSYFDEIYHARTAYEHIENVSPYEISHPPLGKLILSVGIRLFGLVPFGWRCMGTLFGVLMLPAIYVFLKKMFGGTLVPGCGTAILASDFMHFAQTRIATIDTYEVLFIILMYGFFWGFWQADRSRLRSWLPPLALSGVCFGLGAASKWTGFYAGAGLAVLWLIDRIERGAALIREGKKSEFIRETAVLVLWSLLFFVLIPACIYYVSYWPYGTSQGMRGLPMLFSRQYLRTVLDNQKYMFHYHSNVTATHPYSSVWWQWILDVRPILYYLRTFPDGTESSIAAWLNPMLCWGGLCAMLCMLYLAVFRRDRVALFILVGYLAQLLPWVFVTRVVFEYHYFPSSVFLVLALGYVFRGFELFHPRAKRGAAIAFTAVSVALFAAFYPALSGLRVPRWYDLSFLKWLGTWPF